MTRIKNKYVPFIFIGLLFLTACENNTIFSNYKSITNQTWHKNDTVRFTFTTNDTLSPYNLFLNIRNNKDYPFSNLFVIIRLKNSNNEIKIDTLEYLMAKPNGTLLGKGITDTKESKLWYQSNFVFAQKGEYEVAITHALRETGSVKGVTSVPGITDVGFKIEKTK